ncbi:hypothetical protein ACFQI3_03355 [Hansschlegelia quercus]|uniref:Uncharacterized protein n=1 Tax=Hansschlegelia quercus TaxID=2528245 RepID=A0A4Q9GS27_9HYPH|nr:hypothetical protein [Hansschlegelia quercus]TBN54940.1 hypothetical protein EYR15_01960 [Hansschlegelia quercus]
MAYIVRWVPTGPEMIVSCPTPDDVLALADELIATGRSSDITVVKDGLEVDLASLKAQPALS